MSRNVKLSPAMEKLLGLMQPGRSYWVTTIEEEFYGMPKGTYGYVNKGRGGNLVQTFKALERRGLIVKADGGGWRLP